MSLKTTFFGLHFAAESIRASSTTFTQSAQKATEFGEIKQPLGLLRRSRSFKVTDFGTNRKLICDFLLVINTNLASYLAPFPRYSLGKVQNRFIWLPLFGLTPPPPKGFPWDDLCKNFIERSQMAKVPNGVETLPKISIA